MPHAARSTKVALFCLVLAAPLGASVCASAKTVTYKNVVSPTKKISCYAVKGSTEIECTASYLPDIGDLDTYLGLRAHGSAILAERGDFPGFSAPRHKLAYGNTWKRPGIRCAMRTTGLRCRNRDGHGFHIAQGDVRRF
jgi:Family of unknown function (DUF6636)